mmetsp:Transcript_2338/g.3457  ORF Transcript_2338/g.3457 Transcript_2338/m.3457 type:complete len:252 (-) Transcript_2338:224-979(-)
MLRTVQNICKFQSAKKFPSGVDGYSDLLPPRRSVSTEVSLCPGFQHNFSRATFLHVRQSKRQWGRSTNDLPGFIVLRTVARALELLLSSVPWHNTSKMRAYRVQAVRFEVITCIVHDQVGSISLKTLDKLSSTLPLRLNPLGLDHIVAQSILSNGTSSGATLAWGIEKVQPSTDNRTERHRHPTSQDKIHDVSLVHVRYHVRFPSCGHLHRCCTLCSANVRLSHNRLSDKSRTSYERLHLLRLQYPPEPYY